MKGASFSRRPLAHCGVLLAMLLMLLALELALEWRAHQRGFDTLLLGGGSAGESSDYPFRSPPVTAAKASGVTRLWIAGASHAQDSYLPVDQIFPTLTCKALQQQGRACEVINGSQAGNGIEGNLAVLEQYGATYQPDIIVLYQGSIEIQDLSKQSFAPTPTGATVESPGNWHKGMLDPIQQTLESTTLFAHLSQGVRTRLMAAKQLKDALPDSALFTFRQRLLRFIRCARALAAQPVLTTFAARYDSGEYNAFADELFYSQLRYNPFLSRRGWLDSIDRLNQEIRAVAQAEQLPLIDLAAAVAGDANAFRDFSHFTTLGHQRIAATLARGLQPLWSPAGMPLASTRTGTVP